MRSKLSIIVAIITCLLTTIMPTQAQDQHTLIVFSASSLTDAFEAIADEFEAQNPNIEILFNFAGSSTLATQLDQGAPADIFASANQLQMDTAFDNELIAGEPMIFAGNRLVLIVPIDNPAEIYSLDDLINPNINLIVASPDVPVRVYTDDMLEQLADNEAYGSEFRDAIIANIVSEEPNVRQVSAKVALGEADAGIVYYSDVTLDIAETITIIPIPNEFNSFATYPIAITDASDQSERAQMFIDFVLSDIGQDILTEWGFLPICDLQQINDLESFADCIDETNNLVTSPTPMSE